MTDTYSKLLGLGGSSPTPPDSRIKEPVQAPTQKEKKSDAPARQQTRTPAKKAIPQASLKKTQPSNPAESPSSRSNQVLDTSLLTTKEKTKYGTYLADETIEKIGIRAIQLKRDSHQIVQEAMNQYFEKLEK